MTRAEFTTRIGDDLMLPDVHIGRYLVDALEELGPARYISGPNGLIEVPVDWDVILPFAKATQMISEPWEFRIVMDMAKSYVNAKREGENPLAVSPVEQANGN